MVVYDFNGTEFSSTADMCKYYGIPVSLFYNRRRARWSPREILLLSKFFVVDYVDNDGNLYHTVGDVCKHFFIHFNIFIRLYRNGKTVDEIVKANWKVYLLLKNTGCSSIAEYCRATGNNTVKDYNKIYSRIVRYGRKYKDKPIIGYYDLKGVMYTSIRSMCLANNYDYKNFLYLLDTGYSYNDALQNVKSLEDFIVYNGITYRSEKALCRDCGISYVTYRYRRYAMGLSVEDSLKKISYRNKSK